MARPRTNFTKVPGVRIWKRSGEGRGHRHKLTYRNPETGRDKTMVGSADYEVCVDLANKVARRNERLRLGLSQSADERYADHDERPLPDHLADWRKAMEAADLDPKHVRQFHNAARDVLLGTPAVAVPVPAAKKKRGSQKRGVRLPRTGWGRVSQVSASAVFERIGMVKAERAALTANRYLAAVNAFFNWGGPENDRRWSINPCAHLKGYTEDKTQLRRTLEADEFSCLLSATIAHDCPGGGMTGPERARLYRFAVATGLRLSEVRGLRVRDAELAGATPGVWTRKNISRKNKKRQFVPLPASLAADLATAAAGAAPDERLIRCPSNIVRILRGDVRRAGIPYETAAGRFDFHAARHMTGTVLTAAGVSPKAVQEHMRPSRITLTLDTYGHLTDRDRSETRRALPDYPPNGAQRTEGKKGPQMSGDVRGLETKNPLPATGSGFEEWSHGESNPDLLNAIQPSSR
jgi:integrase